jgi:UPF0755 protein
VVIIFGAMWLYNGPGPAAKSGDITSVVLRKGASLPEIASTLERGGVIRSSSIFMTVAKVTGAARKLKAGEYEIKNRASMAAILDDIRHGRIVRHMVTVPEGVTSDMVVDILMKSPVLTGSVPTPPEGAVLPETYQVERGQDRAAVLQRMMDDRDELLDELWAQAPEGPAVLDQGRGRHPGLDRREGNGSGVASVRASPPCSSTACAPACAWADPTIIYGLTRGRPLGRGILLSELQRQTPYNTYFIDGLPPTPIANPGALLSPPCWIRPRPATSISSPTAPAATSSPRPMPSTRPMSPSGARSSAAAPPRSPSSRPLRPRCR